MHLQEKQRIPLERPCRNWPRTFSDLIGIISPYETPRWCLGDPMREATSTHHEWLEDELLPTRTR